jgi:hypothetical protein
LIESVIVDELGLLLETVGISLDDEVAGLP